MKKILSLLIVLVIVLLSVAACAKTYGRYNYDLSEYIDLAEYKNLPAKTTDPSVSDEDVEAQIKSTISYYTRKVEVKNRGAQLGDVITIDYVGYVDGVSEDYVEVNDVNIKIGLGTYPEEFENALLGLRSGNTTYVEVKLPDDFPEYPDYAGKTAQISIYVKALCEEEEPEYTDDFVRAYLGHDSVADYENAVRQALEEQHSDSYYSIVLNQIWDSVLDNTTVKKYPDKEVKYYYDRLVDTVSNHVSALELDFAAFVKTNFDMTEEEFYAYAMENAQETVKEQMIVNAIARTENISISDSEYKTLGEKYAKEIYELDSLAELEEKFPSDEIRELFLIEKVQKFVADNADVSLVSK